MNAHEIAEGLRGIRNNIATGAAKVESMRESVDPDQFAAVMAESSRQLVLLDAAVAELTKG